MADPHRDSRTQRSQASRHPDSQRGRYRARAEDDRDGAYGEQAYRDQHARDRQYSTDDRSSRDGDGYRGDGLPSDGYWGEDYDDRSRMYGADPFRPDWFRGEATRGGRLHGDPSRRDGNAGGWYPDRSRDEPWRTQDRDRGDDSGYDTTGSGRFGPSRYASSPYGYGTGPDPGAQPRIRSGNGSGPYGASRYGVSTQHGDASWRGEGTPRGAGKAPKNYTRSDERIREQVCEMLEDSGLDASNIEVVVRDGEVTLEGTVSHRHDKREAEDIACAARGVEECHNRLRVQQVQTSDEGATETGASSSRATEGRSTI